MFCLRADRVAMWLATIDVSRAVLVFTECLDLRLGTQAELRRVKREDPEAYEAVQRYRSAVAWMKRSN